MQYETYRLYAIHRGTLSWFDETRAKVLELGRQGWELVSASALWEDEGLLEELWFKRPIVQGQSPAPTKWLGFSPPPSE